MRSEASRCWAEIDGAALRRNAVLARERIGAGVALLAVIKANGYGHGLTQIAEALSKDVELFGVANLQEAIEARNVVREPILILGPALPEERAAIATHGFIASVSSFEEAAEFDRFADASAAQLNLVIDTGMGRMGCAEIDAVATLKRISALQGVHIHSVSTHLPVADEDAVFTRDEIARFEKVIAQCRAEVLGEYRVHALLSAGVLAFKERPFDVVRVGLMLYGISPLPDYQQLLSPVMTLKSRVALLRSVPAGTTISYGRTFAASREMRVATLSVGYADGYPRALSNRGAAVLIRGQRCPVLGRITMDLTVVDVSDIPDVALGDEVVLFGRQGNEEILASELAERAGTIAWDILTGIGSRVRRVYL